MSELVWKIGGPAFSEQEQHLVYRADQVPVPSVNEDKTNATVEEGSARPGPAASTGVDASRGSNRTGNGAGSVGNKRGSSRKAKDTGPDA